MALEDLDFKISIDTSDAPGALQSLGKIQTKIDAVSHSAAGAEFNLSAMSRATSTLAAVAQPLGMIHGNLRVISTTAGMAASGTYRLAFGFGLLHTLAVQFGAGVSILLAPLRGLVILPKLIMGSFAAMFAVILAPFRVLFGLVSMVFRGMMTLLKPVIALASAFFRFKLALHSIGLQFQILAKFLSFLPPKIRALVVGLTLLGMAGRAGRIAMSLLAVGFQAVAAAGRVLQIGLTMLRNPLLAVKMLAMDLVSVLARVTMAATGAALSLARVATRATVSAFRAATAAVGNLAMSLGGSLARGASTAITSLAALGAAAVGWGAKTAIGLETAETVFGVLLKDMAQGKALMAALNATKVAPFFDAKEIQNAGRDLIKAGVPVTQVTDKLEQLGQIAVATKTPIDDLSRIYRQGMAKGAFQTDLVNQMAERGIDIYHALESATGLSGQSLSKAMQDGKIGANEMNKAIEHLTTGTGIYAGAVEAVAQTTAGKFSQIGNNITQALAAMMGSGVKGMGDLLDSAVRITAGMKSSFASLAPVVIQVGGAIRDAFGLVLQFAGFVWSSIMGQGQATFSGLVEVGMSWATKFRFFFQNFGDIARFAFLSMTLFAVSAFNDVGYFFTDKMPAYLTWFGANWKQVFTDAGNLIVTVFSNIGTNIRNAMTQIWAFIKSGGTAELKFAFTPLLDGFVATVGQLPDIPERAMSQLEKNLTGQMESLGTKLADNFDAMQADAMQALALPAEVLPALKDLQAEGGESGGAAAGGGRKNFSVESLERGSAAALQAVFSAQGGPAEKQLTEQKKTNKLLTKIAAGSTGSRRLAGAV